MMALQQNDCQQMVEIEVSDSNNESFSCEESDEQDEEDLEQDLEAASDEEDEEEDEEEMSDEGGKCHLQVE